MSWLRAPFAAVLALALAGGHASTVPGDRRAAPASSTAPASATAAPAQTPANDWMLVWQDEFDGPAINRDYWTHEIGGHGWGNRELQYYTDDARNAFIENGHLVIRARRENPRRKRYSSARLTTRGKAEFLYGRIEAKIKIPVGRGLWPAFWMLGANFPDVGWPDCGELDIMENVGSEPGTAYGTAHGPGYAGADGIKAGVTLPGDARYADEFHVFSLQWSAHEISWQVDGQSYFRLTRSDVPGEWVFDQPFFLMLNLAVGGTWPGSPNGETAFPKSLLVDYVRVYQKRITSSSGP